MTYKKWSFGDCKVLEVDHDYDLHVFKVYTLDDKYLGQITPDDIKAADYCRTELDNGSSPIADEWEDGHGNICTLDGWGEVE